MSSTNHDSDLGKPSRRLPRPRLWSLGLAIAGIAVLSAGLVVGSSSPSIDPAPVAGYGDIDYMEAEGAARWPGPGPRSADGGLLPDASSLPARDDVSGGAAIGAVPLVSGRLEDQAEAERPIPVRVRIAALGIDAPIQPVGVAGDEMEVPGRADLVGWYRYGPAPGEPGSAVLAAHVAWRGKAGAFYRLRDLPEGSRIEVAYADGSVALFRSVALESYPKEELPVERVFSREGTPILTLITCGGAVNPSLRSFEENVVAYAVPVTEAFG
ncbi:MAG: class F sortase [Actinobacteria bacterium]|nr:class F sortase [Actinomycetota bacterium]